MDELKDTVELMISENFQDRFKAEYRQLLIRYDKLATMIFKYERGMLDFEPICPISILRHQQFAMELYMNALKDRAKLEGIDLNV